MIYASAVAAAMYGGDLLAKSLKLPFHSHVERATTTCIHQHQERFLEGSIESLFTAAVGKFSMCESLPTNPRLLPIPFWLPVSPIFHKHTLSMRLPLSGAAYPS
jgi:hypothetical protein